jgi:hypothetical protein
MMEFPQFPEEEIDRRFPGGFTIRDEANALMAFAVRGPLPKGNGRLDGLHDDKKITDGEVNEVILFGCKHLEMLLRFKEKYPERYRSAVIGLGITHCDGWER